MTRDRLTELKASQQDEDEFEMLEVKLTIETRGSFMKDFSEEVEEARELVDKIHEDTENVRKVQSAILSAPGKDEKLEAELDGLMAEIKRNSQQVRFRLKAIESGIEHAEEHSESPAEVRIRKIQQASLLRRFVEIMTDYNAAQTSFRQQCKERIQRQAEIAGKELGDGELEEMLETGKVDVMQDKIEMDPAEAKALLRDIEARHEDIIKLEAALKDLHDMFVDIAILVDSQGELIDRIEVQVDNAVEFVDRANADMKKAREFQAKARRKKLMMIVAGSIVGIFVAKYLQSKLGL